MAYSLFLKAFGFLNLKEQSIERPTLDEFIDGPVESKTFKGVVSSIDSGEGVINNDIYFSLTKGNSEQILVGSLVEGEAHKKSGNSAWRATIVRLQTKDWGDLDGTVDENNFTEEVLVNIPPVLIEKVSSVHGNIINTQSYSFKLSQDACSVKLTTGDWVKFEKDPSLNDEAIKSNTPIPVTRAEPIRIKTIFGIVTKNNRYEYIVNDDVVCSKTIFGDTIRLRDKLILEVIESDQGKFNWRAIWGERDSEVILPKTTFIQSPNWQEDNSCADEIPIKILEHIHNGNLNLREDHTININIQKKIYVSGKHFSDYVPVYITNLTKKNKILQSIWVHSEEEQCQLSIGSNLKKLLPLNLVPNQEVSVPVACYGKKPGLAEHMIIFCIDNNYAGRRILIEVGNVSNTYVQKPQNFHEQRQVHRIIQGEKPFRAAHFLPYKLPDALVPNGLWEAAQNIRDLIDYAPVLEEPLNAQNFVEKLQMLIFLEEIQMENHIRQFDIPRSSFTRHGEYLSLIVPGLAEKRPSLLIGDSIIASTPSMDYADTDLKYEGCIHEVQNTQVLLKFAPAFHSAYGEEDFKIEFCFNRTPLKRSHLGISLAIKQLGRDVLFPRTLKSNLPQVRYVEEDLSVESCKPNTEVSQSQLCSNSNKTNSELQPFSINEAANNNVASNLQAKPEDQLTKRNIPKLKWINCKLNEEQKAAVRLILEGGTKPLPYIIFGPPGTGKTITVVEAVLQIYKMIPHSRILVVTPSNSASDLLTERIIMANCTKKEDLIRLNAFNRNPDSIPSSILNFSSYPENLENVVRRRIIICTSTTSGQLYTVRLKNGHFTHLFIDESGQMTEPEACVALGLVNSSSGQIVLAGDPKQLGPVVLSPLAKKFGLANSLLHRLCSSVLYQPKGIPKAYFEVDSEDKENSCATKDSACVYERKLVTLLVQNYRSHADLIAVSSKLFYHSYLRAALPEHICNALLGWPELPNPLCPILMHGIAGENQQEGDSPSWFNPAEAYQAGMYAKSLILFGIKPSDIGIITPYRKQVQKIRRMLNVLKVAEDIKVGSVEEFQGQERMAIIVSTVRSSKNLVEVDIQHSLGFVQCSQRFNVAITRAKCLLIVIGNPLLLQNDPNWNAFLTFCIDKSAYKGLELVKE